MIIIITFNENSFAYRLISVLSAVGECSYNTLNLFGNGNACRRKAIEMSETCSYRNPQSREVFTCKAISISGKGKDKKIRLRKEAGTLLKWMNQFDYYNQNICSQRVHGDDEHINRNFKIAEISVMMMKAGAEILQSKMSPLSVITDEYQLKGYPCFYNSHTIKSYLGDEIKKSMFSRSVGMLMYPGQTYPVYNIQNELLKWKGQGELKTKTVFQMISRLCGGANELNGAIIIGNGYNNALKSLLDIEESVRKRRGKYISVDYRLDMVYRSVFFIESNEQGIKFLETMMVPGWRKALLNMFFTEEMMSEGAAHLGYDAVKDRKYICLFFDHDIAKLERFKNSDVMIKERENCHVFCYPEQVEFVKAYLGEEITTRTIEFDKIYCRYFI